MTTPTDPFTALEHSLNELAAALTTGRADAVLSAEGPVQAAVERLVEFSRSGQTVDAARALAGAIAVRVALLKCRALGHSSQILCRVMTPDAAYAAGGRSRAGAVSTLESRV